MTTIDYLYIDRLCSSIWNCVASFAEFQGMTLMHMFTERKPFQNIHQVHFHRVCLGDTSTHTQTHTRTISKKVAAKIPERQVGLEQLAPRGERPFYFLTSKIHAIHLVSCTRNIHPDNECDLTLTCSKTAQVGYRWKVHG